MFDAVLTFDYKPLGWHAIPIANGYTFPEMGMIKESYSSTRHESLPDDRGRGSDSASAMRKYGAEWRVSDNMRLLRLWLAYLGLYLFMYGLLLGRFAPLWDEVYDSFGQGMYLYITVDRWGLAAYRSFFGEGFQPYVGGVAAGMWISVALVVQVTTCRLKGYFAPLVYGAAYLSSIAWAFQVVYSHQSDAIALGILCATLAARDLFSRRRIHLILGAALLVFALATYQMLLLYYAAAVLTFFVFNSQAKEEGIVKIALKGCLTCAVAVVAMYGVSFGVHHIFAPPAEILDGFSHYHATLSCWPDIASAGGLVNCIKPFLYWELVNLRPLLYNLTGSGYQGQWAYPIALMLLICILPFKARQLGWQKLFALGVIALLPYSCYPLLLMYRCGPIGGLDARMGLAEPLFVATVWACLIQQAQGVSGKIAGRMVMAALLAICILKGAYRIADMARDEMKVQHAMLAQYHEMGTRARILAAQKGLEHPKFLVCQGEKSRRLVCPPRMLMYDRTPQSEDLSKLAVYPIGVFKAFADYCGETELGVATEKDLALHEKALSEMPNWPMPGSVREHQGDIIIKANW